MCSVSKVNELLAAGVNSSSGSSSGGAVVEQVPAVLFKHSRDSFFLVDIREPDEIAADPVEESNVEVTAGKLLHMGGSNDGRARLSEWKDEGKKKIVLLCGSGYRSSVVARELNQKAAGLGDVAVLMRGMIGLRNPNATVPDLLVVLATKSCGEKITLALNACAVAAANNETVVLALMGDGVCTFLRKGNNKEESSPSSLRVEETFVGEPFQPCHALFTKLIGTGHGVVLACTSCCKSRGIEFGSDLLDFVQPMQMPDLLRMLQEAKHTLQLN